MTDGMETAMSPGTGASFVSRQFVVTFANNAKATLTGTIGGQASLPCTINLSLAVAGVTAAGCT